MTPYLGRELEGIRDITTVIRLGWLYIWSATLKMIDGNIKLNAMNGMLNEKTRFELWDNFVNKIDELILLIH